MGDKLDCSAQECTVLDRQLAGPMFLVALSFLLITGAMLHLTDGNILCPFGINCLIALGVLYLLIVAEAILHWGAGSQNMGQHVSYLLMPIFRLCPRDHIDGQQAWVAGIGWREATRGFEQYLSRLFSGPMILIALMVLPIVAVELIWSETIYHDPVWKFLIETTSGFIWMSFVYEFVVMVSIVKKRLLYCKQHWIDLAIVLLPLVSFMGAARLGRLIRLNQLTRTARIYRLRGLVIRAWRAVVTLNVIDKLLRRDCTFRIERLEEEIAEKQREIKSLQQELEQLRLQNSEIEHSPQ
jgi:voltage-gated potassium channel